MGKNNTSSRNEKVIPASASPSRKKKISYKVQAHKLEKASGLWSQKTTSTGVCVVHFKKPDGTNNAFLGGSLDVLKERTEQCKIVFIGHQRHPNGDNVAIETSNKAGNKYPTDVIVIAVDDDKSIPYAVSQVAAEMNSISNNECKDDWKYGIPFFINKGDRTSSPPAPLSRHILDFGCASVIRRLYENCNTKQELLDNPERAAIFTEIFGSEEAGLAAIESIDEHFYLNL